MRCAVILPAETNRLGGVQRFGACLARAMEDRCELETFRLHPRRGGSRIRSAIGGVMALRRSHRRQPFDAVISTFHWPPALMSVPMLGVIHDTRRLMEAGMPAWSTGIQRAILRTWDVVLVPSAHVDREVRRIDPRLRVAVIGEGTDHLERFRENEPAERRHLVVLGGLAPHKRTGLGLDVAREVVGRLGAEALVLGPVPKAPGDARITVISEPTDAEIARSHHGARVVLAPTRYEGFGLAVGEALRLGAPVVHASDGNLANLVKSGGIATDPDIEAMATAVERVWADWGTFGESARKAVEGFTWDATARHVVDQVARVRQRSSPRGGRTSVRGHASSGKEH